MPACSARNTPSGLRLRGARRLPTSAPAPRPHRKIPKSVGKVNEFDFIRIPSRRNHTISSESAMNPESA